jgi:hypothetical protein
MKASCERDGSRVLRDQERDLHAGGLVFIPSNICISLKNIGSEPVSLSFIFSAPRFEDPMRCDSVTAVKRPPRLRQSSREIVHT